ncbi:MAG: YebC/PmpR family DNA-binding transcriptional regulator [Christensenellaceae bacterium]|jgi:YebC/PmpR family DNA-binding regulatory protein|nr:YebC/PmpR family DNA-binding transcriptional regulator [Christensenellaceae bacterium]
MSGHNKWSKIHRKKGEADAAKGNVYAKLGKEIFVAVKQGKSADPEQNSKLRELISKARNVNMPNANIQRAVQKAVGDSASNDYEYITYEGYGPVGVAVLIDCLTNNKNRTAANIRSYFEKSGGSLGVSGSVSFLFDEDFDDDGETIIKVPNYFVSIPEEKEKAFEKLLENLEEDEDVVNFYHNGSDNEQ